MEADSYYKWEVDGKIIKLKYDDPSSPFEDEFDQQKGDLVILCSFFHSRSILPKVNLFSDHKEMQEWHKKNKEYTLFRLMRYEHGAVSFRAFEMDEQPSYPYSDQWDAGMEGFVLAKAHEGQSAIDIANQKLEYLTDFCNGEIFGYVIEDEDGQELDSCWGFVGYEYAKQCAIEAAHNHTDQPAEVQEVING